MDSKLILILVFIPLLFTGCATKKLSQENSSGDAYFKNYALSVCIADGFSDAQVKKEASAAARGYLELGSFPLEAHTEAVLLGRDFLKKSYKSISDDELTLMKCIDFYHSPDLKQLIRKYEQTK